MFEGQPKGLYALALANTGERFGYYTMLAIFTLFMQAKFGYDEGEAAGIYSGFLLAGELQSIGCGDIVIQPGRNVFITVRLWQDGKVRYGHNVCWLPLPCNSYQGRRYRLLEHDRSADAHCSGYRPFQGKPASNGGKPL